MNELWTYHKSNEHPPMWCVQHSTTSEPESWRQYHAPCFNHPPTTKEIVQAMNDTPAPASHDLLTHRDEGVYLFGALGLTLILTYVVIYLIWRAMTRHTVKVIKKAWTEDDSRPRSSSVDYHPRSSAVRNIVGGIFIILIVLITWRLTHI